MPRNPECDLCPLGGKGLTTCVWGEWWGDVEYSGPSVMVLGMNPGGREDAEGRPFVGPSGALLKEGLTQAGVKRAYLTNAAKCVGQDVDMSHARACSPYLEEEIERVRPAFILALGNVAVQRLLGKGTVGQVSGKEIWSARYQAWVLPAYHPAAILRDRGRENAWRADVHRFGRLVRGDLVPPPNTPPVRVDLVSTGSGLKVLDVALRTEPVFSYDFETNVVGGWWHRDFRAYSVAFSFTGGEAYCLPINHPECGPRWTDMVVRWMRERATPILRGEDGRSRRIVHNGMFDDLVWFRLTGRLSKPTFDTILALQLLDENAPKSLKWAGRAHLGWPDWDIDARKLHPIADLYPYNGYDAAATLLLKEILHDRLTDEPALLRYFTRLEMPKLRALQKLVARGIYVDRQRAARFFRQARRDQRDADALVPMDNPASNLQVARWLYTENGLPVIKNGKVHPSTDEATIKTLAQQFPEARRILDCRRPRKKISTYFRPINRMTRDSFDGRLHPDMRTTSVETGRLSGFFHTTPRDTSVRPIFTAPEGMILVQADYKQIEARICAWMAAGRPETWDGMPNSTMLGMFFGGIDIYVDFAARALRKTPAEISKDERQMMGKVPVLAQLYGISPEGLREYAWKAFDILWSEAQAKALWMLFRQRYPEFPAWHRLTEDKLIRRGWVTTPLGRTRRLPSATSGQKDAIRAGINAEPQSLASDITQAAMILLDKLGARVVGTIHDALLVEVRRDRARASCEVIRSTMLRAPDELKSLGLWLPPGLIEVEITAGAWGVGREVPAIAPA